MFINHLNTKIQIYKHLPNDVINYYESATYFMILYYQNLITVAHTNYYLTQTNNVTALVNYLVSKILGKIQGTEMLVDLENLGTR